MAKSLINDLGAVGYDNLINSNVPEADAVMVKLAASQGVLPRGALITGTAGGELSQAAAALTATNATYVLADETDTGTAAVNAMAYRTGNFNADALVCAGGYVLTAADKEILRNAGIMVAEAIDYVTAYKEEAE